MKTLLFLFLMLVIGAAVFCAEEVKAKTIKMLVTAYCPCQICCGKYADGYTSKGDNAYDCDGVATDPRAIPYGTKLNIPGAGIKEVDDTGGAMRQDWKKGIYHIDLRFKDHKDAREWGRKWLDVEILN